VTARAPKEYDMPKQIKTEGHVLVVRDEDDPDPGDLENERLAAAEYAHEQRRQFESGEMSAEEAEDYIAAGGRGA
jgi:hypothetical protein